MSLATSPRRLPGVRFERRTPPPGPVLPRMDVAAFAGLAAAGPLHTPVAVEDEVEFAALFGADAPLAFDGQTGAVSCAHLGPAVRAFFRNGGRRCWIVRLAGRGAEYGTFEVPGLARLGRDGIERVALQARSEGSWADALSVAAALQSQALALVGGHGTSFTFAVSRPDTPAVNDLIRLRSGDDALLFRVASLEAVDAAASPLPGDRRSLVTVAADPASLVRLVRERTATGAAGEASYRDATGQLRHAPAIVAGPDALDLSGSLASAPVEGSLLSLDERLWMTVDEVRATADGALRVTGELVRALHADPAVYGPEYLAERLTFELWVRRGASESWRLGDLGFTPGHPRYAGDLPTDVELYRSREGETFTPTPALWPFAAAPRFPLAGSSASGALLLPLGMPLVPERFAAPLAAGASELERDGLVPFDDRVFLDDGLRDNGTETLISSSNALRFEGARPRRLRGIHALLAVEEPTLVAVPDALQPGWDEVAAPPLPAPDASLPPLRPEWWRFLPCTPPAPGDPTAVPISDHYLCAGERLRPAPALWGSLRDDGWIELGWTGVADAIYVLEEALAPDWSDASVAYRGHANERRLRRAPGTRYVRVRAEAGAASSDWSNPVEVHVEPGDLAVSKPPAGHFLDCGLGVLPVPTLRVEGGLGGTYTIIWDAPDADYRLQEASRPDWSDAHDLYRGTDHSVAQYGRPDGVYFYRVRVERSGQVGDWSAGVAVRVARPARWERTPADAYDPDLLFTVQQALLRMCAARGDQLAVLALPEHYGEDAAIAHAQALSSIDSDPRTASFGALYHPWLTAPAAGQPGAFNVAPPDGAAAGVMARRALTRGAWVAPANEPLRDVVLLAPRIRPGALPALQDAQVNVVRREPRGVLWLAADTLSHDPELRPIGVRRLLSLLRRAALLAGAEYVFESNDDLLRNTIHRGFDELLGQLYERGAFSGATPSEAFRVVTGSPPNTRQSIDAGRLIVELRVAPSQPLAFLDVRLLQGGDGTLIAESR